MEQEDVYIDSAILGIVKLLENNVLHHDPYYPTGHFTPLSSIRFKN